MCFGNEVKQKCFHMEKTDNPSKMHKKGRNSEELTKKIML